MCVLLGAITLSTSGTKTKCKCYEARSSEKQRCGWRELRGNGKSTVTSSYVVGVCEECPEIDLMDQTGIESEYYLKILDNQ